MFFKSRKTEVNKELYIKIVREYLNWVTNEEPSIQTTAELSEVLRYSLCRVLQLPSESATISLGSISSELIPYLDSVVPVVVKDSSVTYRQGLLEACVLGVELAREKVHG